MTTKVLGEATGIQWQGVQDHTQGQPSSNGVPLLIGSFKRGRTDKPMIIHNGNIQSELGYEPHNPDYIAVQSMLDMGVPNVNVLRASISLTTNKSSCASFQDENQIACPRISDDGGLFYASYKTDLKEKTGFYIKIHGNKYNSFNGLADTSAVFEKSICGGSIQDLLTDPDYNEFIKTYPLNILIAPSDDGLSLVTLTLGNNTEYLEHVFQINIAQNTVMLLDSDTNSQKLSTDKKNISFCLHKHDS